MKNKVVWIILGPLVAYLFSTFIELDPGNHLVTAMAAIAIWLAIWWITECIPLAITALIPIFLFPLSGITSTKELAHTYTNHIIFLFIGGFIVAFALEKWNLHKRIAFRIISIVGCSYNRLLFGIMFSSFFLSMWISNMATTLILLPTCLALIKEIQALTETDSKFRIGLLLGIAYAASIGGTASLIGTAPNLVFLGYFEDMFTGHAPISFSRWFIYCFPLAITFFACTYFILRIKYKTKIELPETNIFKEKYKELGKISYEEIVVLVLFSVMTLLWFTRVNIDLGFVSFRGWQDILPHGKDINDSTIAIIMACILFVIPAKNEKGFMMDWQTCKKIPFDIILLFGGGFALAKGFEISGLSVWIGSQLMLLKDIPNWLLILIICSTMTFITELTSNTATSQLILPILASTAIALHIDPVYLLMPATLSASYAFMLPISTPPNAIVFGAKQFRISDMASTGLILNVVGIILMTIYTVLFGDYMF